MASACLDARHFSFSLYTTGAFQSDTLVLEIRGSESEYVSLRAGSLRGTAWDSRSFSHQFNPCWFLQPEVMGMYLLALEPVSGGLGVGLGLLTPAISLPIFNTLHQGETPAHSASEPLLPVWMDVVSLIL